MTRQITINKSETEGFAARIRNRGQSQGTQTVELYKNGVLVTDQASLTLTPDETAYVLEAPTVFSDDKLDTTHTMEVSTENMTRTVEAYIMGFIESFEADNLNNYSVNDGNFALSTTNPFDGSQHLKLEGGNGEKLLSFEGDGFSYYAGRGSKVGFRYYTDAFGTSNPPYSRFVFGAEDSNNYYGIFINGETGEVAIDKVVGGTLSNIDTATVSWSNNVYYYLDISYGSPNNADISVDVVNTSTGTTEQSLSVTNTEVNGSGFGVEQNLFGSYTGQQRFVDYITLI